MILFPAASELVFERLDLVNNHSLETLAIPICESFVIIETPEEERHPVYFLLGSGIIYFSKSVSVV